ncbi:hypothetical protein FRC02_011531 [Tulasnella sp. 418]|nr:hypothetical protein FRC02_011531 [Tulasnella sp. 418]
MAPLYPAKTKPILIPRRERTDTYHAHPSFLNPVAYTPNDNEQHFDFVYENLQSRNHHDNIDQMSNDGVSLFQMDEELPNFTGNGSMEKEIVSNRYSPTYLHHRSDGPKPPVSIYPNPITERSSNRSPITCGICFSSVRVVVSPVLHTTKVLHLSQTMGMTLACPGRHSFCIQCLNAYVRFELEKLAQTRSVISIGCPDPHCRSSVWRVPEELARTFLSKDILETWNRQQRLGSTKQVECPYQDCSNRFEVMNADGASLVVVCPRCFRKISITDAKPLPVALRNANNTDDEALENQALLELIKDNAWQICSRCGQGIEKASGTIFIRCTQPSS